MLHIVTSIVLLSLSIVSHALIDRHGLVTHFNPSRNASSLVTPMQVGNGNFAFGADITGLQTFLPYGILTSWGWKNDSLPPGKTQADIDNYKGASWDFHGRPVQYDFGGDPAMQLWLISNPNRVNLGRVGLVFLDPDGRGVRNVTEDDLQEKRQTLDLWTGKITSRFTFDGTDVVVTTVSSQTSSAVGITLSSTLMAQGELGLFVDFPWNEGTLFSAPFVGRFDVPERHTTTLDISKTNGSGHIQARIAHALDSSTFYTSIAGSPFAITRDSPSAHRYTLVPQNPTSQFHVVVDFSLSPLPGSTHLPSVSSLTSQSDLAWAEYWEKSGFVDVMAGSTDERAEELQRRIVLSRYLVRVNAAGDGPPQESGLVNNGWSVWPVQMKFGKFHMEMYFWHVAHFALWSDPSVISSSYNIYNSFLPTSLARAQTQQGFSGARWPKMTDPSGRSSPEVIANLLLWQQPHPIVFASYELRGLPPNASKEKELEVRKKWAPIIRATADFMASFAFYNTSTGVYDLGPPVHVVSEDTAPNSTLNPAFELAYWRFGLSNARDWLQALNETVPPLWQEVEENLAPLPVGKAEDGESEGLYMVYEGIESDFWDLERYTNDHPALVGLVGWLPPTEGLNLTRARLTADKVWAKWNISNCWGWDFPMLALNAARTSQAAQAVDFLLHPLFRFDDVGMPLSNVRVPSPYFPGSGALLYAVGMMVGGWDGVEDDADIGEDGYVRAPGFPSEGWRVRAEGILKAL
ncbi:hypothetical protein NLJ89_g6605 [Agrocybe chaxingu]|uniref:Six-hairpin glycosidase-like protein n=1 Tax=Agrocybe chaxingu TaxID=84603 RepID=A0A9W8JYU3_9AGAR|nr:hypothetical protein NLJ89_g6605 [Agrocybe chaxingu]